MTILPAIRISSSDIISGDVEYYERNVSLTAIFGAIVAIYHRYFL